MNEKLLIRLDNNIHEFKLGTIRLVHRDHWEAYKEVLKRYEEELNGARDWFGPNQYIEYESVEQFLSCITEIEIPDNVDESFIKHLTCYTLDPWVYEDKIWDLELDV